MDTKGNGEVMARVPTIIPFCFDWLDGRMLVFPFDPPVTGRGRISFEWLSEGSFLVQRWEVEHHDSRVYERSLRDGVWKLWRDSPGFSQRFTGTFGDDGNTITGFWEKSGDGEAWEHDFDLAYTKQSETTT